MITPREIVQEAIEAANAAGDEWMTKAYPRYTVLDSNSIPFGVMLDLCGNAHLVFSDRRSSAYKKFLKEGLVRNSGNYVIEIRHKHKHRQEHGLQLACIQAAKKVFIKYEINVTVWSYID